MDVYSLCYKLLYQSLLLGCLLKIVHDLISQVAEFKTKHFVLVPESFGKIYQIGYL